MNRLRSPFPPTGHHDLTGPVRSGPLSWPEALELLSAELGVPVTFRVAAEQVLQLLFSGL